MNGTYVCVEVYYYVIFLSEVLLGDSVFGSFDELTSYIKNQFMIDKVYDLKK